MAESFVATATSDEQPNAAARRSGIGMRSINKYVGASLWQTRAVTSRKQSTPISALFKERHLRDLRDDQALR